MTTREPDRIAAEAITKADFEQLAAEVEALDARDGRKGPLTEDEAWKAQAAAMRLVAALRAASFAPDGVDFSIILFGIPDLIRRLGAFYSTPAEVAEWLQAPQRLLGGRSAIETMMAGKLADVEAMIAQLEDGAYV